MFPRDDGAAFDTGAVEDYAARADPYVLADRDAFVAAGGTIVDINPAERASWAAAIPNIASEWAKNLDGKGEPGSAMLKAYLGKLRSAGFKPLRDWDAGL